MTDYLAYLDEIPVQHAGLITEQIERATMTATLVLRRFGQFLPGGDKVPTYLDVRKYLKQAVNMALEGYFETKQRAPAGVNADEIWGECFDALFTVRVTGMAPQDGMGFTATIDFNLLYEGE